MWRGEVSPPRGIRYQGSHKSRHGWLKLKLKRKLKLKLKLKLSLSLSVTPSLRHSVTHSVTHSLSLSLSLSLWSDVLIVDRRLPCAT